MTNPDPSPPRQAKQSLSPQHTQLLTLLGTYRFMRTDQFVALLKDSFSSHRSATRQLQRHLAYLEQQKLIYRLQRRIGGWEKGSGTNIWALTEAGYKLVFATTIRHRRRRYSVDFVDHTLEVTQASVDIITTVATLKKTNSHYTCTLEQEPKAWRDYLSRIGDKRTLKPDLTASIYGPEFTDHYFFEIDRATENLTRIMRKMHIYGNYLATGAEQDALGVFPAVVWVVPTTTRRDTLARKFLREPDLPHDLWIVITNTELPTLIAEGPTAFLGREPG